MRRRQSDNLRLPRLHRLGFVLRRLRRRHADLHDGCLQGQRRQYLPSRRLRINADASLQYAGLHHLFVGENGNRGLRGGLRLQLLAGHLFLRRRQRQRRRQHQLHRLRARHLDQLHQLQHMRLCLERMFGLGRLRLVLHAILHRGDVHWRQSGSRLRSYRQVLGLRSRRHDPDLHGRKLRFKNLLLVRSVWLLQHQLRHGHRDWRLRLSG